MNTLAFLALGWMEILLVLVLFGGFAVVLKIGRAHV